MARGWKCKKSYKSGAIRHPNQSVEDFEVKLDPRLQKISSKNTPCVIIGDIYIDFLRYGTHSKTEKYIVTAN